GNGSFDFGGRSFSKRGDGTSIDRRRDGDVSSFQVPKIGDKAVDQFGVETHALGVPVLINRPRADSLFTANLGDPLAHDINNVEIELAAWLAEFLGAVQE